jgi:predicted patatin/cPLA2 family phospholipase
MKTGLVLEGGAMRGLWTAGITDVMMEHDVWPDALIGVSAGAAFGCNYKSRQAGRAIRYNIRFAHDSRFSGIKSLLTSGDYFNADFGYHVIPKQYDVFDDDAFRQNPMEFIAVCTDVETGQPVYRKLTDCNDETYEWIRASASMPLMSRVVQIGNKKLLDGGVSDSIPLEHFEQMGYRHNVVILTQPLGYRKTPTRLMPLMRIALRKYPNMVKAMDGRYLMYNRQLDYVAQAEREGRCIVIRPEAKIPIGHVSHNPDEMRRVYEMGRSTGEKYWQRIKTFYEN